MKTFIYYDLGSYKGEEIDLMLAIFKSCNIDSFKIYAFEPCRDTYLNLCSKYRNNEKIILVNAAIYKENSVIDLYYAPNSDGHSIFSTKCNVYVNNSKDKDNVALYEKVDAIVFSDWVKNNVNDYGDSINILKFNIEGAEYYLIKDLVISGLLKNIHVICGDAWDVKKVSLSSELMKEYCDLLIDNNINVHCFSGQGNTGSCDRDWMQKEILRLL